MEEQFGQKISNLTPEQINLIMKAAQEKKGKKISDKMPRNAEETYPLSKAQERLWFLSGLSEGEPVYNNPVVISMKGDFELDLDTMKRAVNEIAVRHDILRTTFHLKDGQVVQKVHRHCDVPVTMEDLRILGEEERKQYMTDRAKAHGNFVFDLTQLPLIRVHFLRMADDEYVILINAHHIITDGWTNSMFAVELPQLYEAFVSGRPSNLPPVTRQYIDYVQSELEWLKSEDFSKRLQFWKDQFSEIPASPMNFVDHQGTAKTYKGGKVAAIFNEEKKAAIHAFCRKMKITPFEFVSMAYATLVHRYSGMDDIVIGTPVANRNDGKFQQTFGPFINTLPIKFHFEPGQSFSDFIHSMSPVIQQALSNQAVPFAVLVEELNPERDVQSNSLFQLHFAFQSFPQLQNTNIRFENIDYNVSKFDLNLWVEDDMEKWIISITYRVDSFKEETVQILLDQLLNICDLVMAEPDKPLGQLNFLDRQQQSIIHSTDTIPDPPPGLWPALYRHAASHFAARPALTDQYRTLTYGELDRLVSNCALYFAKQGVQKGDLVAVALGRSSEMIITMLALFRLGAAYLPVEVNTPEQRLHFILSDAGVGHIVVEQAHTTEIPGVALIQYAEPSFSADIIHHHAVDVNADDLAYVIYTSGTTGNPKGVRIGHGSLYNYTAAVWQRMQLNAGDTLANISSLAADLGNTMIFPALGYGCELLIVPEACLVDATLLSGFFAQHRADALKIVPSHLLALLDAGKGEHLLPSKLLVLGGEACSTVLLEKIKSASSGMRIINHYGPTEATVGSLTYEVPARVDKDAIIPIGRPLANTSVYLLDRDLQPVPNGAKGEIYLGGRNLALGYLNRPETEATHFITNPFRPTERLYKTGDHGRVSDGNVYFLGRKDRQVKIRGHRIELNEVEYVLRSCKGVQQALVLPPLPGDKDQVLTGVLVLHDQATTLGTVREEAGRIIKSPMLPDKFLLLDTIPVTANGKANEQKIRKMAEEQSNFYNAVLHPRDEVELRLLNIWKDVLGLQDIGIEEDFFEIGGHSLLAIKLLAIVSDTFNIQLPLAILFEHKNVKEMARIIRAGNANVATKAAVTLQKSAAPAKFYLVHPAGGNVMSYFALAKELRSKWNVYGIRSVRDGLDINALAAFYLDEIIDDIGDNPVVFSGWSMGALIAHSMCIQYGERTGRTASLVVIDQPAPAKNTADYRKEIITAERLAVFAGKVSQLVGADIGITRDMIESTDAKGQSALFFARFREHGLVPEDIKEEDFHGFLELMIHHNEITMDYDPSYMTGDALIIRASERMPSENETETGKVEDDMGWRQWVSDPQVAVVPGNHITIINAYVHQLAEAILKWQEQKARASVTT